MEMTRVSPRKWSIKIDKSWHNVTISEELENWLNKPRFSPEVTKQIGITKLNGIPIEQIFESIIDGNKKIYRNSDRDYSFGQSDLQAFEMAIQRINQKF